VHFWCTLAYGVQRYLQLSHRRKNGRIECFDVTLFSHVRFCMAQDALNDLLVRTQLSSACAAHTQSWLSRPRLTRPESIFCHRGSVPFPRGFAFGHDGQLFLASGIGPNGQGDNTIVAFTPSRLTQPSRLVADAELSPLDLAIAPNGNIVVSSEHPFGALDAFTTVREYDATDGHLVRVFFPNGKAEFRKPRGLRFAPNGDLYCVARDEVVGFDFASGECLGSVVRFPRLNGQALAFFPLTTTTHLDASAFKGRT
jgi:hypothetical protein